MRGNSYLSRPHKRNNQNQPFSLLPMRLRRRKIETKEVFIGNLPSNTELHHTKVSDEWLPVEALVGQRRRKR